MSPRDDHGYSYGPQVGAVLSIIAVLILGWSVGGVVAGLIVIARWLFF